VSLGMSESAKADKSGPLRQKFSPEEDQQLRDLVTLLGENSWTEVAAQLGTRTSRQCRERFRNYLSPQIRNDPWTPIEDVLLREKFEIFGAKWSAIVAFFPTRSEVNLKNRWAQITHKAKVENDLDEKRQLIHGLDGLIAGTSPMLPPPSNPAGPGSPLGGIDWTSDGNADPFDITF
jgi:hypothetical protein